MVKRESENTPKDITIKIPRKLHEDVDKFITTTKGRRYTNTTDFYKQAIRKLLHEYETKSGIKYRGQDEFETIILKDYDLDDVVTLTVKKNRKKESILICNTCNESNCPHRNFVKVYKPLWGYLKTHNLKIVNYDKNNN